MAIESLPPPSSDVFIHVRIIVGLVLGISVAQLVRGAARFVQHPHKGDFYLTHFLWVISMFLLIVHFWWFEFAFAQVRRWTFALYFLLIFYSVVFVMLSSVLFPDSIAEYKGFRDYFRQRRRWFYALLLLLFVIDILDTLAKGQEHFLHLGLIYPVQQFLSIAGATAGLFVRSERYDTIYAVFTLIVQLTWVVLMFEAPG